MLKIFSFAQGRVVINEYMPWPACAATTEFIELLNFGPGPMNIGCYVVTNGTYAVTIPPNTIIQPGEFFVLAGQNSLPFGCGNIDSAVTVQLNWNTCNCTNTSIPTTGDGFMQDGGSANEKIILLDPNWNVIDAVSRDATPSSSIAITTSTVSGGCSSKTFDLDTMSINYETLGMATGKNNSFARRVDGDCEWIKTPQQSAHATNNKAGNTPSVSYNFSTLSASECTGTTGTISITVNGDNVAALFPMHYTLAYDRDSNYVFDLTDTYTYGSDNTSPNIDINNLAYGHYRITVASALGCNLKNFDFFIFNCYGYLLSVKLISFKFLGRFEKENLFEYHLSNTQNLQSLVLEASDGGAYYEVRAISNPAYSDKNIIKVPLTAGKYYRLRMTDNKSVVTYSNVLSIPGSNNLGQDRLWPNPALDKIKIRLNTDKDQVYNFVVYDMANNMVKKGAVPIKKNSPETAISIATLKPGLYQLLLTPAESNQPISLRFVKQ